MDILSEGAGDSNLCCTNIAAASLIKSNDNPERSAMASRLEVPSDKFNTHIIASSSCLMWAPPVTLYRPRFPN